jgi:hypothetical protein
VPFDHVRVKTLFMQKRTGGGSESVCRVLPLVAHAPDSRTNGFRAYVLLANDDDLIEYQ